MGLDKFSLIIYIIRKRFPRDLVVFYGTHSLSIIFIFMNAMRSRDFTESLSPFVCICKLVFILIIFTNLTIFLLIIIAIIISVSVMGCFPSIRERMRQRLVHLDRLIEQGSLNTGFGRAFIESQPLDEEEMQELQSFVKTCSYVEEFCSDDEFGSLDSRSSNKGRENKGEMMIELKQ